MVKLRLRRMIAVCGLALAACGGDPIAGDWRSQDVGQFAMYADSVSQLLTFSAGNKTSAQGRVIYKDSIAVFAKCQESTTATGTYALSGGSGDQSLVFNYASGTIAREGCANAADNQASRAFTAAELTAANTSGGKIVFSGNKFTLSSTVNGQSATYTFTKQ